MLRDITLLYAELIQIAVHGSNTYVIYGDPAYPISELILKPYCSRTLTPEQVAFNKAMSSVEPSYRMGIWQNYNRICFFGFQKKPKTPSTTCRPNV